MKPFLTLLVTALMGTATLQAQDLPKDILKGMKKKNPAAFVQAGDLALTQKNVGSAAQYYEQAIYFDPNYAEAYLKYADLYKSVSPSQAIEKLNALKQQQPNNPKVDKAIADVYYTVNQYNNAIRAYEVFINTPQATDDERLHYAFALFMAHRFNESIDVVRQEQAKRPNHAALNRLAMYNYTDMKQYKEALTAADRFFHQSDSAHYSNLDTLYYQHIWEGMSDAYEADNNHRDAIASYRTYYELLLPAEQSADKLLKLGRLYYSQGTDTDSVRVTPDVRQTSLLQADSVFTLLAEKAPDSYVGNFWRARTNSALDPETTAGKAKPYYEATAGKLITDNNPRHKSLLVECYSYLGYYYLLKNDLPTSKDYWKKILTLDPDNTIAKRALEGIK
jgi:tetratricopeptide (TPR) repeat protein